MKSLGENAKVYLVGGAVRDHFMGRPVVDRDWCVTGSSVEEMLAAGFTQVGAAFPVFLHPDTGEEYALARRERKVGGGYHGFEVEFSPDVTIEEDIARRDLRCNAMAISNETGLLIDPFNGRADIAFGILDAVSIEAFKEDPLRVIRTLRFAARYEGFSINPELAKAMEQMLVDGQLNELPDERFVAEIKKVISDGLVDRQVVERFFELAMKFQLPSCVTFFGELTKGSNESLEKVGEHFKNLVDNKDSLPNFSEDMAFYSVMACIGMSTSIVTGTDACDLPIYARICPDVLNFTNLIEALVVAQGEREDTTKAFIKARIHQLDNPGTEYLDACNIASGSPMHTMHRDLGKLMAEVKAVQFPGLDGKELGAAIFEKRCSVMEQFVFGLGVDE